MWPALEGKQLSVVAQAFLDYLLEGSHMLVENSYPALAPLPMRAPFKQVVGKAAKGSKKSGKVLCQKPLKCLKQNHLHYGRCK